MIEYAAEIRDAKARPESVRATLRLLGQELGCRVSRDLNRISPLAVSSVDGSMAELSLGKRISAIVTTKHEAKFFGQGLAAAMQPAVSGYMNFEGRHGLDVLDAPIRDMELPDVGSGSPVDALVIGKSILASGCTAVSLTRAAAREYHPRRIVVASIFYSLDGLRELQDSLPGAFIYVVGDPIPLQIDGTLGIRFMEELM